MSYYQGISMAEDLLQDREATEPVTEALVREILLEDFDESELKGAACYWLSEYGCRDAWKEAVRAVAK